MTKNTRELRKAIVHYRVRCDSDLADRDAGVITQEEYADSISHRLDIVVDLINQTKQETIQGIKSLSVLESYRDRDGRECYVIPHTALNKVREKDE